MENGCTQDRHSTTAYTKAPIHTDTHGLAPHGLERLVKIAVV